MNSTPDSKELNPAADRLMDALLAEHARLGQAPDHELVENILRQTARAGLVMPMSSSEGTLSRRGDARPLFGPADWLKSAAMAAGIALLGIVLLKGVRTREQAPRSVSSAAQRQEQVFQLVIEAPVVSSKQPGSGRARAATAYLSTETGEIVTVPFAVKASVLESLDSGRGMDLADSPQPPSRFELSVTSHPKPRPVFTLAANQTSRGGDEMTYSGDVVLTHRDFILKADSIVVDKRGAVLKAHNASLTHRAGAYETRAHAVTFSPASGSLTASGIVSLTMEGREKNLDASVSSVIFDSGQVFLEKGLASPHQL